MFVAWNFLALYKPRNNLVCFRNTFLDCYTINVLIRYGLGLRVCLENLNLIKSIREENTYILFEIWIIKMNTHTLPEISQTNLLFECFITLPSMHKR